jgi:hypothetical protein
LPLPRLTDLEVALLRAPLHIYEERPDDLMGEGEE